MRFFLDQLINSMEHYDEREFVSHMSKQLKIDPKIMKRVWKNYLVVSPQNRHKWWPKNWTRWLKMQGIVESLNEVQTFPPFEIAKRMLKNKKFGNDWSRKTLKYFMGRGVSYKSLLKFLSKGGFKEKDVLQKWVDGEEIPQPPKPKSPPPPPPQDIESASDEEIKTWKDGYEKWSKENDHLPNLLPFDQIQQRVQQAQLQRKNNPQGAPGQPPGPGGAPTSPVQVGDYKVDINTKFYYVVINGVRETVFSDVAYINSLRHQYFQRESDGKLTKVVGDANFNKNSETQPQRQAPNQPPVQLPKNVKPQVKEQIKKLKKERDTKKKSSDKKSKENKKTIKGL